MTTEHQPGSPVTAEQAHESHQRLVDHFFGNPAERPRVSIPARLDRDDDLVVSRYIDQAEAEVRTLRARVESYAMDLAALEGTNAANEGALRIQLERLHGERSRAEAAEARVKELEDRAAGYLHAFKDGCERSIEAVAALEARITDLEAQLAAAREAQWLEARVAETLGERFMALSLVRLFSGTWRAEWEGELSDVRRPRPVMRAHAADLPALLRAILAVEKGGPDEG
jgi:hypothetical protein